jgi:hypothetical protein
VARAGGKRIEGVGEGIEQFAGQHVDAAIRVVKSQAPRYRVPGIRVEWRRKALRKAWANRLGRNKMERKLAVDQRRDN